MAKDNSQFKNEDEFWDAVYEMADMQEEVNESKKRFETLKGKIKLYMIAEKIESLELEDLKKEIVLSEAETSTFNKPALIEFIEEKAINEADLDVQEQLLEAIKEIKDIDTNQLESLLFNGVLTNEELKPYTTTTTQKRMNFKDLKD